MIQKVAKIDLILKGTNHAIEVGVVAEVHASIAKKVDRQKDRAVEPVKANIEKNIKINKKKLKKNSTNCMEIEIFDCSSLIYLFKF